MNGVIPQQIFGRVGEAFEQRVLLPIVTGVRADRTPTALWISPVVVLVFGAIYGGVMGSWDVAGDGRWMMIPFAAIKVPMLVLATTVICLPAYFVLATVAGLREDFYAAFSSIVAGQAATALALGSLSPVTRFAYHGGMTHSQALMLSAGMFGASTIVGYAVMLRRFRPLIARRGRHRAMLVAWVVMYAFVGIQLGWMLRPFVGSPGLGVSFFRPEPFTNAYEAVAKIGYEALMGEGDHVDRD